MHSRETVRFAPSMHSSRDLRYLGTFVHASESVSFTSLSQKSHGFFIRVFSQKCNIVHVSIVKSGTQSCINLLSIQVYLNRRYYFVTQKVTSSSTEVNIVHEVALHAVEDGNVSSATRTSVVATARTPSDRLIGYDLVLIHMFPPPSSK